MPSLVSLLLALRLGSLTAPQVTLSIREEARLVAAQTVLHGRESSAPPLDIATDVTALGPRRPDERPAMFFPASHRLRAGDIVVLLVRQLHADETPVGRAAIWVVTRPVQVDASSNHFFVRVRIAGP